MTRRKNDLDKTMLGTGVAGSMPKREKLPDERKSITKSFQLVTDIRGGPGGEPSYVTFEFVAGLYPDGRLGEVFVNVDKMGTTLSGLMDAAAINLSIGLQYGIPLQVFTSKLKGTQFAPNGFTGDKDVPNCSSPLDLLAKWLDHKFLKR